MTGPSNIWRIRNIGNNGVLTKSDKTVTSFNGQPDPHDKNQQWKVEAIKNENRWFIQAEVARTLYLAPPDTASLQPGKPVILDTKDDRMKILIRVHPIVAGCVTLHFALDDSFAFDLDTPHGSAYPVVLRKFNDDVLNRTEMMWVIDRPGEPGWALKSGELDGKA